MEQERVKKDYKFLILICSLLAVAVGLGIYLEKLSSDRIPEPAVLPDEADTAVYSDLVLSEVLTNNGGVYISEDGLCCDVVELYNGGSSAVDLFGYGLSDRGDRIKWAFPDVSIGPGEYLAVNLTGKSMEGLNANFKLSSKGGEELILINNKGKIIDAVKLNALGKNQSMIRDGRNWLIVDHPTPGFENSEAGLDAYRASLYAEGSVDIAVNELLPKNNGNYINEHGRYDGYIEFINISDSICNLSDYYISNDISSPFKYQLPKYYLSPGEIYLLYAGDNSYSSEEYTGFGLQNKTGSLFFSKDGKIITQVDYENVPNGCAYIRNDDGSYYINNSLTPGFPNNAYGVDEFQKEHMKTPEGLIISEVMTSNNTVIPQNGYQFYDWVEFYNGTGEQVLLSDYSLATALADSDAFRLPETTLDPGAYYVLMCSGNTELSNNSYVHSNIKLGNAETLYLIKDGKVTDSVFAYDIPKDMTYSRDANYGWTYTSPTPGSGNHSGYRFISPAPSIDLDSGAYNHVSGLSVSLSGPGNIYFTMDGSEPNMGSYFYAGPIYVSNSTVIKAKAVLDGGMMSETVCHSYILNDPHAMPVASISMDPWQYNYMYHNFMDTVKFPAYFELFDGDKTAASLCGIGLSGYTGRQYNKKNYGLKFDSEYGAKSLDYQVFEDLDCSSFDSLVLRGGSNAEFSLPWKDEFASKLAQDCLLTKRSKTCALYINGIYKGIFNLREKVTPNMIAENFNVDKSKVNISRWSGNLEYGQNVWPEVLNWAAAHDLSSDANYYEFCRMVDVEELCDLWIFQMYMDNPDIYNIRVYSHPDIDGGRCKFIYFDLDLGFYGPNSNYLYAIVFNPSGYAEDLSGHQYDISVNLNLLRNQKFRQLFLERLSYHLHNSLSTDNTIALFDYYTNLYAPEITRDLNINGYSTDWYNSNIYEFRYIIANRTWTLMSYAQYFFGLSSAEMSSIFGDLY
ncbi:MAG: lamin tail domain-containing protein [Firmicutes bacterium]|nr:lamin tail domain-containing protein [Bacillota bacterium]